MKCSECCKIKPIYNKKHLLCKSCYNKRHISKKRVCDVCKELSITHSLKNNKVLCRKCYSKEYKFKEEICFGCKKTKPIVNRKSGNGLCNSCRIKFNYPIENTLRKRLCKAFKMFTESGKVLKSKDYNIDYKKIIDHIGPCPGKRSDYHIDHIFPLSAFDFNDKKQVEIAFSPENHRWLNIDDNLKKGSKYDIKELEKFIKCLEA